MSRQVRASILNRAGVAACVAILVTSIVNAGQILRVPGIYPTIQAAIDDAGEGDMVLVAPGTYREVVKMKAGVDLIGNEPADTILTAEGTNAVVQGANHCRLDGFTITGHIHEDIDGVYCQDVNDFTISNNVIKNCTWSGVNLVRSAAVLRNNVIFGNRCAGVFLSYPPAKPTHLINNTIWDNANEADINLWHGAQAFVQNNILQDIDCDETSLAELHFNDIVNQPAEGDNLQADPLFVDPNAGDFHLKSQAGRWDPKLGAWMKDDVTSPCIDAGDPNTPVGYEPLPDGDRINMGVYGGTLEASKSMVQESVTLPSDLWQELLDSVIGESNTTPIVLWGGGYVEGIILFGESHFPVPNVDPNDPTAVALRFLDTWQDLFAAPCGAMAFELGGVIPMSSRTLVSFRQTYAGLEVFGATFNITISSLGGVRSVGFTDLMTDATALDRRPDSIKPSIGSIAAQHLAEAYMSDRHGGAAYVASSPELMIYAPEVVRGSGSPRPAWHTVVNPANGVCGEMLLLDACSGEIILSNPLCVYADRS